ncbi:hypothetical protein Lepto7375DRAFT_7222 [Leptolyngbya sp. PCC 7375]|nr:hypothetical protein Lepto7375DRAFT_7222 [Leptolyngbya sp. PCC 7375]
MSNFILSRHPNVNKYLVYGAYGGAAALLVADIHISAMFLNDLAIANGTTGLTEFEAIVTIYLPTIASCLYCLVFTGIVTHPKGIPSILGQIRGVVGNNSTPLVRVAGHFIPIAVVGILVGFAMIAYKFDFWSTQNFLGLQVYPLFDYRQLPTWMYIAGPELLFVSINAMSLINGGPSGKQMKSAAPAQGQPQQKQPQTVQVPHQGGRQQPRPQQQRPSPKGGGGNPWNHL